MTRKSHTPAGSAATELILEVFRFNGRLLAAGDHLVSGLGLTSARWQVMGAIAATKEALPVAWLARSMGLNRQGVQRIVNEMVAEGLLELQANPHHRRAHLVAFTATGRSTFAAAERLQIPWVNEIADEIDAKDIEAALRVVAAIRQRLDET